MNYDNLNPVRLYCPNCGKLLVGYKTDDGSVNIVCKTCLVRIYSKHKSKQEILIKMKLPQLIAY